MLQREQKIIKGSGQREGQQVWGHPSPLGGEGQDRERVSLSLPFSQENSFHVHRGLEKEISVVRMIEVT